MTGCVARGVADQQRHPQHSASTIAAIPNRVYVPLDALAASRAPRGATRAGSRASAAAELPGISCWQQRTETDCCMTARAGGECLGLRLGLEVSVIQTYAEKIVKLLQVRGSAERSGFICRSCNSPQLQLYGDISRFVSARDRHRAAGIQDGVRAPDHRHRAFPSRPPAIPPLFRSAPQCGFCRPRNAKRCFRSTAPAPACRRYRRFRCARAPNGSRRWRSGAVTSMRALPGPSVAGGRGLCAGGQTFGLKREDFSGRHRRHGKWTFPPIFARRTWPRSTSVDRVGGRRRPALGKGVCIPSPDGGERSPIISAARCSLPSSPARYR